MKFDFSGWATKNDLLCSDGRTIRKNAFKLSDGKTVPLVWNHQHSAPDNVLGHALLENRENGVYAYCSFNDSESGQNAKKIVEHGDVRALSIYANQLKQSGMDVLHGAIQEVSLVLAGANPGAFIDSVLAHGSDEEAGIILGYDEGGIMLYHAEEKENEKKTPESENKKPEKEEKPESEETVADVFDTLNEKQKTVVYAMLGQALENEGESGEDDEGGSKSMKHNVFENEPQNTETVLSHSQMNAILEDAKRCGSLRAAIQSNIEEGQSLMHSLNTTGMVTATGNQNYGFNDPEMLFPEYRSLNTPPEWISRNMDWVQKVLGGVHHTPFSRIKSMFADITEDEARAKGYIKGNQKKTEVFTTLKRTTEAQMIYKLQKLDRQDIIQITDFDVVSWIRAEMRVMLNEEIARAILIGDGRQADAEDKIHEQNIRPIVKDVPLFNITVFVEVSANPTEDEIAKALIRAVIKSRKQYKGSGNPTFWTSDDYLTDMLLLEDGIGHKLYKTEAEVATALRAKDIVTVEPLENQTITYEGKDYPLIGTLVNLADYNVGTDKGGEITNFEDFDIDFNQYKYLIETMFSGALVKPFSAITFLLKKGAVSSNDAGSADDSEIDDIIDGMYQNP